MHVCVKPQKRGVASAMQRLFGVSCQTQDVINHSSLGLRPQGECLYFSCSASSPQAAYPSPARKACGLTRSAAAPLPAQPANAGPVRGPSEKERRQRGDPLCNPPYQSGAHTIHRRRPEFVCSGPPAPAAARRHVLHIVRIRLTANAHSFRRSAFPQPAHVVGPGRGPHAWQGPQNAPG